MSDPEILLQHTPDFLQLFHVLPDAVLIVDYEGTIVLQNRQAEKLFGYTSDELIGQPLEILLPERFRQAHIAHRKHYAASPRVRPMGVGLSLFGMRKDGLEFPVDISLGPMEVEGTPHVIAIVHDMTQQRVLEREKEQQVEQIRRQTELIQLAHDAIIICDPIGRIVFWNRGAEQLYGWAAQEALGHMVHILLQTRFPGGRALYLQQLEQEGKWEGEITHLSRTGQVIRVESRQMVVRNSQGEISAVLEMDRDRAEQHREHVQMPEATSSQGGFNLFREILDALPNSIHLVAGHDARLVFANQAAQQLWGAQWSSGQPMEDFLRTNQIEIQDARGRPLSISELATMRAIQQQEAVLYYQEVLRFAHGSHLAVLVNAVPLTLQATSLPAPEGMEALSGPFALVIYQNVSFLKEAEYLKDEFISVVAHELRTPLAVLMGYTDMLLVQTERGHGVELAAWQKEALNDIKEAVVYLTTLTDELLDVTRLEAGRLQLNRSAINILALLRRIITQMQQTTKRHRLILATDASAIIVSLDAHRMEQVLSNLLENAVKYSPQGGEIVVTVEERREQQQLLLSMQDHGIGIPEQQQAQIFGRFMRANNAHAWGIRGTGLGLYLCRQLVEQHQGKLWFESREGQGSTFFLSLPLHPISEDEPEEDH
uniref:histidine kinase n=1 Tax=Thermosporothrix sp. COM3 TaxID=2490863 RepID=A0A455SJN7_9CHLR|nr:hypothetical protein KTC_19200 [Thermosporothrix sp. COM3]